MENLNTLEIRLSKIESLLSNLKTVLNFKEVSDYTGLSRSYLYKLTCSGGIPCYKPQGKHVYFNKVEIDKWLMQNRKATSQEIESTASTFLTLKNGLK